MRCIQQREKLPQPEACPDEVFALLLDCWKLDAGKRISAAELHEKIAELVPTYSLPTTWLSLSQGENVKPVAVAHSIDLTSESAMATFASLQVPTSSMHVGKLLGEGEFGQVMLGTVLKPGGNVIEVAIKTIKESGVTEVREQFLAEAKLLSALNHPNIVAVVAVHISDVESYLALEFMAGGDLANFLRKADQASVSETDLLNVLVQLSGAMAYLEKSRVVHRDLAARNALVGADGLSCVKLSDVGMSRALADSPYYRKTSSAKVSG